MPRKGVKCFKFGVYNAVDSRCPSFGLCVRMHMHPVVSVRLTHTHTHEWNTKTGRERGTRLGGSEEFYSDKHASLIRHIQCFQYGRTVTMTSISPNHLGCGWGQEGGVSGRKDRFNSSKSHYTSVAFLRPLFLGAGLLLVLGSALPVVLGSALRLYLRGLVDEVSSEMGAFSVGVTAWGLTSESSCSWQQNWPVSGCFRSAPSWWALQKELGHSWQKASEFFPQTSQWCQGQSQRPEGQWDFKLHLNTKARHSPGKN